MNAPVLSLSSTLQRLKLAPRGQWVIYHTGYLFMDRIQYTQLNSLAHAVYVKYVAGEVCLVQRRLGDMRYEYYAVKR